MRSLALLLVFAACTDDGSAPAGGGGAITSEGEGEHVPGGGVDPLPAEGEGAPAAPDPGVEGEREPVDPPGGGGEAVEGEGEGEVPVHPRVGAFGTDCDDHDDCLSGFCIQTSVGQLCTVQCSDECPRDWNCRALAVGGADPTSLCFPPDPILCEACGSDDDCGGAGDLCLEIGRAAYCGVACSEERPCEQGYECIELEDARGVVFAHQCVPESGSCQPCEDGDGDGYGVGGDCLGPDCDDGRQGVHPGAQELCNRRDDDCDLEVDELFDFEGDLANCGGCDRLCAPAMADAACQEGECVLLECQEGFFDIDGELDNGCEYGCNVEAEELCDATVVRHQDGIVVLEGNDEDCDGAFENGFQPDAEGRSLGEACGVGPCEGGLWECSGAGDSVRCSTELGGSEVQAPAEEICNGVDDTCSGDLRRIEQDRDGDGWLECVNGPDHVQQGDCDDDDWNSFPGARERCDNRDNDCDGLPDRFEFNWEGNPVHCGGCATDDTPEFNCRIYFDNRDGNVQRPDCEAGRCVVARCRDGWQDVNGDPVDGCEYGCLATNDGVEICDGLDNDCDGRVDAADGAMVIEDCELQQGVCAGLVKPAELCVAGEWRECEREHYAGWGEFYEEGEETRCDLLDNDCDGEVNEWLSADEDNDGHYLPGSCEQPADDCDDRDRERHPGLNEVCDGKDNDCDHGVDDGLSWDEDRDGHYRPDSCAQPADDCDDRNRLRYPGNNESCDGHDNDCNGSVDPDGSTGCVNYFRDVDNDGYGVGGARCMCSAADPQDARQGGDCYDGNGSARPTQAGWFTSHRGDGSYDYNCDGAQQKLWTAAAGTCRFFGDFCDGGDGYDGGAPACGAARNWISDCYYSTSGWPWEWGCFWRHTNSRTEACR